MAPVWPQSLLPQAARYYDSVQSVPQPNIKGRKMAVETVANLINPVFAFLAGLFKRHRFRVDVSLVRNEYTSIGEDGLFIIRVTNTGGASGTICGVFCDLGAEHDVFHGIPVHPEFGEPTLLPTQACEARVRICDWDAFLNNCTIEYICIVDHRKRVWKSCFLPVDRAIRINEALGRLTRL